jgi:hypothetical protein
VHQHVITSSKATFTVDGMFMPANYQFRPSAGNRLIKNSLGLGIYVPDASNLHVVRTVQSSNTVNGNKSSSGDVFTAWFDNSEKTSYEYVVLMNAEDAALQEMSETPNYEIIEQSSKAHIVRYLPDSITGFAIFDPTAILHNSWIIRSSRPVFAMIEKTGADEYLLSVTDPDFNRPPLTNTYASLQGPYGTTSPYLFLSGHWQLDGSYPYATQISASGAQSIIQFTCFDAQSYEVKLKHTPVTGIGMIETPQIEVYPNPGNDLFTISSEISGTVYDSLGSVVLTMKNSRSVNLAANPKGVYLLKWYDQKGSGTVRLVKK